KKLPNEAAFVVIGADAPVTWLEKQGISFVERPHWYALGPTDQVVESVIGKQPASPKDWQKLAAMVLRRAPAAAAVKSAADQRFPLMAAKTIEDQLPPRHMPPPTPDRTVDRSGDRTIESADGPFRHPDHPLAPPMAL